MSDLSIRRSSNSSEARRPRHRPGVRLRAYIGGTLASGCILVGCAAIMASWQAGTVADLFLIFAAAGLLLRLPTAILLWAGLTLLAVAIGTLPLGNVLLTERLGNLLYYDVTVACLWALWHLVMAGLGWRLPLQTLLHRGQSGLPPAVRSADDAAGNG